MADNVDVTEGSGKTVASDDIQVDGSHSQGQVQFVKLVDGTLNGTGSVRVNQAAKANALTVAPASDISDATYIGDIKFGEALPANTNTQEIVGDVAENSNAAGNPVLVGGRYDSSPRTLGDTDVGAIALAVDGAVHIDDGGNTITVDGTVTANLSSTDNTVLDNIQTAVELIDNAIDGNYLNTNMNIVGTDVAANAGTLNAQTLRVTIATDDECNNYLGTIDADTSNMATSLGNLGNSVDGNYLNVNMNIAGTDVSANAGTLTAQTLRVTIATDDEVNNLLGTIDTDTGNIVTAVQLIDDAIYIDDADWSDGTSKHMLVGGLYQSTPQTVTDGDVAPLEIDVNGKIIESNSAAIAASLSILDDWDDTNYCNVNINIAGTDCDGGSGAQGAQTLRVILATDDPAVALLTTIDSDTNNIKTAVEALDNAVDGNFLNCNMCLAGNDAVAGEGAIDSNTLRVTIATDDDGVAHLATIAGDTTGIETAVEIMDDWDATHASAAPADGAQAMGAAYSTALPTDVGADADAARLVTDRYGRLCTGLQPQAAKATLDNADTTTAREVVAATASRKIYVTSLILSVDTAGNYWLEDGDATQVTGKFYLAANGGVAITFPEGTPLNTVTVNKALNVKGSTAGNVSVTVTYYLAV